MENYNQDSYEDLVDADIQEQVAAMSHEEITAELAKMEEKEKTTEVTSQQIPNPEAIVTKTEQKTLDKLIVAKADGNKALQWLLKQRKTGLDTSDIEPREVVEGQYLRPDSIYQAKATKQLKDAFVNRAIENTVLPIELIKEMNHASSRDEAQLLLKKYGQELKDSVKDKANAYLLEQSQVFDLPSKLRRKIGGLSASNLAEAKRKVSLAIKNFKK